MALAYISPTKMSEYRQAVLRFAKGADSLECIRSHYFSEQTGECDLTGAKEQSEIFVLANRSHATLKVSPNAMQIVANILDIKDADQWYEHLKSQKRSEKERIAAEAKAFEEKKNAPRGVLIRRKPTELLRKNNS